MTSLRTNVLLLSDLVLQSAMRNVDELTGSNVTRGIGRRFPWTKPRVDVSTRRGHGNGPCGLRSNVACPRAAHKKADVNMKRYTKDVCNSLSGRIHFWPYDAWMSIINCVNQWTWGRNHNFLHNMKGEAVPSTLLETKTRDYEDAGLLLNSPYFSVLRKERDIDLIISLDFSEGDPFMTVKEAAKMCKELNIPFPEVNIPSGHTEKPIDFYLFKGKNTPTVIHIPLFNMVNCGGDIETWRNNYKTFQGPYSAEMITDLVEVAGKNITNNKDSLLEQICAAVGHKEARH